MLVKELKTLYPEIYKRAMENIKNGSNSTANDECTLCSAFTWGDHMEGHNFWSLIDSRSFETAKKSYPEYFNDTSSQSGEVNLMECHGRSFEAYIEGKFCSGKITVENDKVYLCQDVTEGSNCSNKQGYRYSWTVISGCAEDIRICFVTKFQLISDTTPLVSTPEVVHCVTQEEVVHCVTQEELDFASKILKSTSTRTAPYCVYLDGGYDNVEHCESNSRITMLTFDEWCSKFGHRPDFKKSTTDSRFVSGKWYKWVKHTNIPYGLMYCKGIKLLDNNSILYDERINVSGEFKIMNKSYCAWDSEMVEVNISEIQQYLPAGHVDKETPKETFKLGDWVYAEKSSEDYRQPEHIPVFQVKDFNKTNEYLRPVKGDSSGVHMKHCRLATQAEIREATGVKSDSFVLPERWCVKRDGESHITLNEWFNKGCGPNSYLSLNDNWYLHYPNFKNGEGFLKAHHSSRNIVSGYTEITFEQFKQHVLKETTNIIKEPVKEEETMFRKGDYIVTLKVKNDYGYNCARDNYCFKIRINHKGIYPEIDLLGNTLNGHDVMSFDKKGLLTDWRYATSEEIAEYDRLGKPFDVTTMNMKTTSINMKAIQEEAKRRFPIGCRFRCTNGDEYTLVDDVVVYKIMNNMIYASDGLGCLYKDGQWATLTGVINTSGFNNVGYVDTSVKYSTCLATTDHTIRVSDPGPSIKAPTSTPLLLNKTKQTKQLVNLK